MNNQFPYPGLRPYEQNEADIFFGREEHTDQLLEKLGQTRFLAIVGPSGCGKSSLARAGLLAGLKAGFLSEAGIHWRIAEMRPGNSPYANLAQALLDKSILGNAFTEDNTDVAASLSASLSRGPFSLLEILQNTHLPPDTQLLILVDQFEEIFRYYDRGKENVNEAASFVSLLLATAQYTRAPTQKEGKTSIYVVITMRDEYLRDCAIFQGLPEAINQGIFLPPRLTRDQLREAIELPAQVFGDEVKPALVNCLLNEIGNDQNQLPVLQHALMRMWRLARAENPEQAILSLAHYQKIGGLEKALSQHADRAYAELDPAQQKIAEILFRNLTGANNTRRPIKLTKIAALANVSTEQIVAVVEIFRKEGRSFLTPPLGKVLTPNTMLDISHESLIRLWQRLKNWTDDEAESAKRYRRLEDNACHWNKGQAPLLRSPELEIVLAWHNKIKPTPQWAKRYGKDFDLAMRFLTESGMAQKRQKRFKQKVFAGAFIVTILLCGYLYFEGQETKQLKQQVEQTEQKRTESLFDSHLTHTALLARVEDYAQAKQVLSKTYELDKNIPAERRHARNLLAWFSELMGGEPQQVYKGADAPLFDVAVSPDGRLLATVGEKGTVVLFDVQSGQLLHRLQGHDIKKRVETVIFHPQGKWLASAGEDKQIILWSTSTGDKLFEPIKTPDEVYDLAINHDGTILASNGKDNNITLWDMKTRQVLQTFKGDNQHIPNTGIAFSPSGELLASASTNKTACLWEIKTGIRSCKMKHGGAIRGITFNRDGSYIATRSDDKTVRLWDADSGKELQIFTGHQERVAGLSFSTDGQYVISSSEDQTLRIWDIDSGITLRVLQGHKGMVHGITIHGDNIFSAGYEGTVIRWNAALPFQQEVDLPGAAISSAIAPNGKSVAIGFENGTLRLYSLPKADLLWEQEKAHTNRIQHLTFNSDGTLLATASYDQTAKLWQVKEDKKLQEQRSFSCQHRDRLYGVTFSPDSHTIVISSFNGQIGFFSIDAKQSGKCYKAHDLATSIFFDTSGTRLLSSGVDGQLKLWNIKDKQSTLFSKIEDQITWAALSPDNKKIASVGTNQLVYIYTADNQQITKKLVGHKNTIYRVIFSQDSQQIATVSSDTTVRLWDLNNGNTLFTLQLPEKKDKDTSRISILYDFDFRCTPQGCFIAVPLYRGKLLLYELGQIYD